MEGLNHGCQWNANCIKSHLHFRIAANQLHFAPYCCGTILTFHAVVYIYLSLCLCLSVCLCLPLSVSLSLFEFRSFILFIIFFSLSLLFSLSILTFSHGTLLLLDGFCASPPPYHPTVLSGL